MNRREFIGGALACATTGCVATKDLPETKACGDVFPKRGVYERLSLGYARVEVGATKPFSILHISDTHLTAAYDRENERKLALRKMRTQTFGGHQEEALRDSLAWAKEHVDYVLHTGDLIDWQSEANFDLVRRYFGKNMFGSVGNHEYSPEMWLSTRKEEPTEAFRAPSRAALAAAYPFDLDFEAQMINGVSFVTLDDVFGTVTAGQVRRFKAAAAEGLPIVLAMHVPIFSDRIWQAYNRFWVRPNAANKKFASADVPPPAGDYARQLADPVTRDFIAYLRREPLLKAVLTGHLHFDIADRFSPTAMQYVVGGNFLFRGQEILFV